MPIDIEDDDIQTALRKLKAREDSFRLLEKINKLGSWEVDLTTHESSWSENSYNIYEIQPFSIQPTLELFFSFLIEEDRVRAEETLQKLFTTKQPHTFRGTVKLKSGKRKQVLINGQALFDENGLPTKLIGTTQDITEQVKLEEKSQELSSIIENSSNEIYIVDYETAEYLYVNHAACEALGYSREELLGGMGVLDINKDLTPEILDQLKEQYKQTSHTFIRNQTIHTRKDGTSYHVQSHIQKIHYNAREAYVLFDTDVTENLLVNELVQKQSQLLFHQANHDTLTNLPNRTHFQKQLSKAIKKAQEQKTNFALLFIDLDHFKDINDSLGHHVGDQVLQTISKRLSNCIRPEDDIARLGGDEFTIILHDIQRLTDISNLAHKIIDAMKTPIKVASNLLHITTSIGIAIYPEHAQEKSNLLKFADTAMYKAKEKGRNNYQLYSAGMSAHAYKRVIMENSLRIAIKEKQFDVYYQPQINLRNEQLTGMEALVRWIHPNLGVVPPSDFIPLAEELGLIVEIDTIVMHKAMQQFSKWYEEGLFPGKLSLNLAMQHLQQDDFVSKLFTMMQELHFQKEWLELEVTETQVMNNPKLSIKKLQLLHSNGIGISVDDFGTGYSSLSYLKKLPLNKLKIDKSFIDEIPDDEDDIAITKAIIALAKSLNLGLIAEGVETTAQKDFLFENGCECMQGYLYSKPIPANEMQIFLQKL
jgi:diguanylate cyclase (GGDEF)-like protein/PAS domain S-box-containing protein